MRRHGASVAIDHPHDDKPDILASRNTVDILGLAFYKWKPVLPEF